MHSDPFSVVKKRSIKFLKRKVFMLILSEGKNMDHSHFKQHAFNHLFVLIMRKSTLVLFLCHHYSGPSVINSWCHRGFETVSQKIFITCLQKCLQSAAQIDR